MDRRWGVRDGEESKTPASFWHEKVKDGVAINVCTEGYRKDRFGKDQQFGIRQSLKYY